ncbi:MAG: carboxypeptidase-like regulatory domain-containing protein [Promethearchaeota archaeon]
MKIKKFSLGIFIFLILMINTNMSSINAYPISNTSFSCNGVVTESSTGDPIYHATVKLYGSGVGIEGHPVDSPKSSDNTLIGTVYTNSLGTYTISAPIEMTFSTYIVEIIKSGYITQTHSYPPTHGTFTWNVNLVPVAAPFSATGAVTMIGGSSLSSATVRVKTEGGSTITSTTTSSSGSYSLNIANPGSYSGSTFKVEVSKTYFETKSTSFSKYGVHTANFQPKCTNGQHWYGIVSDESSNPIDGASVIVYSTHDGTKSATTNSNGKWDIVASPDTEGVLIQFRVSKSGYQTYSGSLPYLTGDYERNVLLLDSPTYQLAWTAPTADSDYTFGPGEGALPFNFGYSQNDLDEVKLYLNGIDIGSVWNTNTINLAYNSAYDGAVTAVLKGYAGGIEKTTASRNFNFTWIHYIYNETLEENYTIMPSRLYTIIHDPSGDGSSSTYEESSSFKLGVGVSISAGVEFEVSASADLFGVVEASASDKLELEFGAGYDFEYKITTSNLITSSLISDDPDFIGPGYGDIYWGEGWIMQWRMIATHIEYYDTDKDEYNDPRFEYGINRSSEMILSNNFAPDEWKELNPVFNNYQDVIFNENKTFNGGNSQTYSKSVSTTHTLTEYLEIKYSQTTALKLKVPGVGEAGASMTVSVGANVHGSQEWNNEIKTSYTLADDDTGDTIIQEIGSDPLFGTPIFRLVEDSSTSNPLEHGSTDYIPPEIGDPTINYDSDGLSPSPSESDSPLVHVHITDEGGVANAWVYYSTDNITFSRVDLVELSGSPNNWEANIPVQEHGDTVYWYIRAGDLTDHYSTKYNQNNEYFTYEVVNRDPVLNLISPNNGGTFAGNINISWTGTDPDMDSLTYSLGYSFDGVIWNQIILGLTNNSYIWDISGFGDQPSVVVRVIASDGYLGEATDISDYGFAIDNPDAPEITYIAPLGGSTYSGTQTIQWEINDIDNFVTSIDLEYSVNSGETWQTIVNGLAPSVESYDWDTSVVIFSEEVKIRVVANYVVDSVNYYVFDISALMTIDNRPVLAIDLLNPNGGELFENEVPISWDVTAIEGINYQIDIDYTTDGNTFTDIVEGLTNNSYFWNTDNIPSGTNYRIRVNITGEYMGYELESTYDISDVAFTIDPIIHDIFIVTPITESCFELGTNITYSYVVHESATVTVKLNNTIIPNTGEISNLSIGYYNLTLEATYETDYYGEDQVIFQVNDTTEPNVTIDNPSFGQQFYYGDEVSYSYEIEDFSPTTVEIMLNGEIIEDTGSLTNLNIGAYLLEIKATDSQNNIGIASVAFSVKEIPEIAVTLLTPNGGESVSGLYNITWNIENPQNENLQYNLYYSLDNGENWTLIASGETGNFYIWDTSSIENINTECLVKIEAISVETDEILSSDVSDSTFTIVNSSSGIPGYDLLSLGIIGLFSIAVLLKISSKKFRK